MRLILIGFGTIGQNLARLLEANREELRTVHGFRPKVVAVVDRRGALIDRKGLDLVRTVEAKQGAMGLQGLPEIWHERIDASEVLESVECEAVVELTPTNLRTGEPALSHLKTALRLGRHVVTTNKGPIALALPSLTELAEHNGVLLRFSGTVGGGTPILDLARKCLVGNRILGLSGILNGTTNYILTRMAEDKLPFASAMEAAKELGYAEADASYDIDGVDTAAKLVIAANWVMRASLTLPQVQVRGIRGVGLADIQEAEATGQTLKLIGRVEDGRASVAPERILRNDPLNVSGALNAITFTTALAGKITLVGQGSGGEATASAVLRDLLDIRKAFSR